MEEHGNAGVGEVQRESQLCIPQTDMTREQYAAIYRESFSMGSKSQSEEKVSGSFPNGGQNGEIAQSGIDMKRLENRGDFSPVTFQNKPAMPQIDGRFDRVYSRWEAFAAWVCKWYPSIIAFLVLFVIGSMAGEVLL